MAVLVPLRSLLARAASVLGPTWACRRAARRLLAQRAVVLLSRLAVVLLVVR